MKKVTMLSVTLFVLFLFVVSSSVFAQTYGKVLKKTKADRLFGRVYQSSKMSVKEFNIIIGGSSNTVMLNILKKQLYILGDKRKVLYPAKTTVDSTTVFHVFSKSKVEELLKANKDATITVEIRKKHLTVTHGTSTLEFSTVCPPWCP
ncbi:MAG: hypothetical protein M1495_04715 [Bacteroidetes bacterium]|nr:hypothetical protein [Bacteroidota bacterium]